MNPISFIIGSPHHDSGIKSLGSKSIFSLKKNSILEKQCRAISKSCKNINHEIIFINNIDHYKTVKYIEKKKLNIKYVYLNQKNVNYAGCFLKGMELAKHDTVVNIDCGLIMSHHAILETVNNNHNSDINICCVGHRHKQNADLQVGCVIREDRVHNVFFGLENKYIGINRINKEAKSFILENFSLENNMNKYVFEIINSCISKNLVCKKQTLRAKMLILFLTKNPYNSI